MKFRALRMGQSKGTLLIIYGQTWAGGQRPGEAQEGFFKLLNVLFFEGFLQNGFFR